MVTGSALPDKIQPVLSEIELAKIIFDPAQEARHVGPEFERLLESIRRYGLLQYPGFRPDGEFFRCAYGAGRGLCYRKLGKATIPGHIIPAGTSEKDFLLMTGAENEARKNWTMPQLTDYFASLAAAGMTQREIASALSFDEGQVSKHRTISTKGIPELLDAYRQGLDFTKSYTLAKEEPAVQIKWLPLAGKLTAEELRARLGEPEVTEEKPKGDRKARIKIEVGGYTITVSGVGNSVDDVRKALKTADRELKSGQDSGMTLETTLRAAAEKAKAKTKQ